MKIHVLFLAGLAPVIAALPAAAAENYLVTEAAAAHAKPSKDSASDHSFEAGQVITVTSCRKDWCQAENESTWVEASRIKRVRGLPGSVDVKGFGHIPKEMYLQAKTNCAPNTPPDPAGCLCQDGAAIGACGD